MLSRSCGVPCSPHAGRAGPLPRTQPRGKPHPAPRHLHQLSGPQQADLRVLPQQHVLGVLRGQRVGCGVPEMARMRTQGHTPLGAHPWSHEANLRRRGKPFSPGGREGPGTPWGPRAAERGEDARAAVTPLTTSSPGEGPTTQDRPSSHPAGCSHRTGQRRHGSCLLSDRPRSGEPALVHLREQDQRPGLTGREAGCGQGQQ